MLNQKMTKAGSLMEGNFKLKTSVSCILLSLCAAFPALADNSGKWRSEGTTTGQLNGTVPTAESATVPVYQGSIQLDPSRAYDVLSTAKPKEFSAALAPEKLILTNPEDTEGDLFSVPPQLSWQNDTLPVVSVVWAKADTPETPLTQQPTADLAFCAQGLGGQQLVVWSKIDPSSTAALLLHTTTGVPDNGPVLLVERKVLLKIGASVQTEPLTAVTDHYSTDLKASKVKVGETITLTVTVTDCGGNPVANAPFSIRRGDAINRQGTVNSANPVSLDSTVLTNTSTEYKGTTGEDGTVNIAVTQKSGEGVKTPLYISTTGMVQPIQQDVIFTVVTSPDSTLANMWGHMPETLTAANGTVFARPKLSAEANGGGGTQSETNEVWAIFNHKKAIASGANAVGCGGMEYVPSEENLHSLYSAFSSGNIKITQGWPVSVIYKSSTPDKYVTTARNYNAVNLSTNSVKGQQTSNSVHYLVCQKEAAPVIKSIAISTQDSQYVSVVGFNDARDNGGRVKTFDALKLKTWGKGSGSMTVKVTGSDNKPLKNGPFMLLHAPGFDRQGGIHANHTDTVQFKDSHSSSTNRNMGAMDVYYGTTNDSGELTFSLSQPQDGTGLAVIMSARDDDYVHNILSNDFPVIFATETSPDTKEAKYWGYMSETQVLGGRVFNRPKLVSELPVSGDSISPGGADAEVWAGISGDDSLAGINGGCAADKRPTVAELNDLRSVYNTSHQYGYFMKGGWPAIGKDTGQNEYWTDVAEARFGYMEMYSGDVHYIAGGLNTAMQICAQ
ncbi:hypothetical protein TRECRb50_12720 [Escherichia coli]|uniref:adhesion domain-containing protein n=1 Tax=Escherichia coli TaxID=562 RepID=UPI0010CC2BB2|nr:DUF823 domain-containing adhesin [Escherichia coli]MBS8585445.1 RatA [Escherichia coli]BDH32456.1 hypothetical protein TRECRb50_12720 [Escherichia coli]